LYEDTPKQFHRPTRQRVQFSNDKFEISSILKNPDVVRGPQAALEIYFLPTQLEQITSSRPSADRENYKRQRILNPKLTWQACKFRKIGASAKVHILLWESNPTDEVNEAGI
jgi:hypothetical protein